MPTGVSLGQLGGAVAAGGVYQVVGMADGGTSVDVGYLGQGGVQTGAVGTTGAGGGAGRPVGGRGT